MLFLVIFGNFFIWNAVCIPDFVKKMSTEKQREYEALQAQRKLLTRTQFHDLCQAWAQNQSSRIKKEYRQYRRDEERYITKRDLILRARLNMTSGSEEAKKYLSDLLDLQSNMNIPLGVYEAKMEQMRQEVPPAILKEAIKVWNMLDPAHVEE